MRTQGPCWQRRPVVGGLWSQEGALSLVAQYHTFGINILEQIESVDVLPWHVPSTIDHDHAVRFGGSVDENVQRHLRHCLAQGWRLGRRGGRRRRHHPAARPVGIRAGLRLGRN